MSDIRKMLGLTSPTSQHRPGTQAKTKSKTPEQKRKAKEVYEADKRRRAFQPSWLERWSWLGREGSEGTSSSVIPVNIIKTAYKAADCDGKVLEAVRRLAPIPSIITLLDASTRANVEGSSDIDVLHHAIVAGHDELACWLLTAGHSLRPQPGGVPYLVLACTLGRSTITESLLELQPASLTVGISARRFSELLDVKASAICRDLVSSGKEIVTALDAAAAAGSLACVRALLSNRGARGDSMKVPNNCQLERAVRFNCPSAVQLLCTQPVAQFDVERAIGEALRRKSPSCLALLVHHSHLVLLFRYAAYHSLYMHVGSVCVGLAECTAVLLDSGCSVNAYPYRGTFPLHSLLYSLIQEKDYRPSRWPSHHMDALNALLAAGADTNHNEVTATQSKGPMSRCDLFTSSLNALLVPLQSCDSWWPHVRAGIHSCVRLLLDYGADAQSIQSVPTSETPLHQLMKALAMQHAMGHVCAHLSDTRSLLLRHGAYPDHPDDPAMPAVHYFCVLCERMGGRIAFERWHQSGAVPAVVRMLVTMSVPAANQAVRHIRAVMDAAREDGVTDEIVTYVNNEMAAVCTGARLLTQSAALVIWQAVGRKQSNLQALHMPTVLRASILNMFD